MPAYLDLLVLAVLVLVIVLFVLGLRRLLRRAMKQPTRESGLRRRTCTRKRA